MPLLLDPALLDSLEWESPWLSSTAGPSQADQDRLHRLLARIPTHWGDAIKRHYLLGETQASIGRSYGIAQASVSERLATGLKRMLLVARNLPDLIPNEVEEELVRAGIRDDRARVASLFWREHRTTVCGVPQPTAYDWLFRGQRALVNMHLPGTAGKIVEGVKIIRTWPSPSPITKSDAPVMVPTRRPPRTAPVR